MTRFKAHYSAVPMAICVLVLAASAAGAEERVCTGTLGGITVDNLRVPQNRTCTLDGTRVMGTAKVESNATLLAEGSW